MSRASLKKTPQMRQQLHVGQPAHGVLRTAPQVAKLGCWLFKPVPNGSVCSPCLYQNHHGSMGLLAHNRCYMQATCSRPLTGSRADEVAVGAAAAGAIPLPLQLPSLTCIMQGGCNSQATVQPPQPGSVYSTFVTSKSFS